MTVTAPLYWLKRLVSYLLTELVLAINLDHPKQAVQLHNKSLPANLLEANHSYSTKALPIKLYYQL